jgi:hypothetical protein
MARTARREANPTARLPSTAQGSGAASRVMNTPEQIAQPGADFRSGRF